MTHHEELSEYELKRLATIAANKAWMDANLGTFDTLVPKKKQPAVKRPKQPKPELTGPSRKSRRLSGGDAPDVADAPEELQDDAWRNNDPDDVSRMSQAEKRSWCDQLRDTVLSQGWFGELTEQQQQRVHEANDTWLGEFTWFTAQFDMQGERPLSRPNIKNVLKAVMKLVSGAGITCDKREGSFAEGRPLRLGVTAEEVDQLRAEAQLWCPLPKSAPADLVGRIVDGVVVPRKPPSTGPHDTSNGWLLNHPLKKVKIYCEYVDECRLHGQEATLRRLMGTAEASPAEADAPAGVDEPRHDEPPRPAARGAAAGKRKAGKPAAKAARPAAKWAEGDSDEDLEGFIAADGEDEGAGPVRKKRVRARPARKPATARAAAAADDEDDEDAPLSMRVKPSAIPLR